MASEDNANNGRPKSRVSAGGAAASAGFKFQQQVGAWLAQALLANSEVDPRFELSGETIKWIRFEAESPVDDIIFGTSNDGIVAIQVKTTASLSFKAGTPLGKTIEQFVRHWQVCTVKSNRNEWQRPLDASKDRLILLVGPQAPSSLVNDFPSALRRLASRHSGDPTIAEREILDSYKALVSEILTGTSDHASSDDIAIELAKIVRVIQFDPTRSNLIGESPNVGARERTILSALESHCGQMMRDRDGFDEFDLRRHLRSLKVIVDPATAYAEDIKKLKKASRETADSLKQYEYVANESGGRIGILRDCQGDVEAAATSGSLLIIGEPGAGKSAVLNSLAASFRNKGIDVVEFAVDRFSATTLDDLKGELGLQNPILDTLFAWDGAEPGFIFIDALDAARGGASEGIFRFLIDTVLEKDSRWKVVASIRSFDLRMGQKLKTLFKGIPPIRELADPTFSGVRHVRIPSWTDAEFEKLLDQMPVFKSYLETSSKKVREIAAVPFNTRLICDLISGGLNPFGIGAIASQSQLLNCYWENRVTSSGIEAESAAGTIIRKMIERRRLKVALSELGNAAPIQKLIAQGVIVLVNNNRDVQFRHHILFDYAACRTLIDPTSLSDGTLTFSRKDALGLTLAPALIYSLSELWEQGEVRRAYWKAILHILYSEDCDPVISSVCSRSAVDAVGDDNDIVACLELLNDWPGNSNRAVQSIVGALSVRLEDSNFVPLSPWITFTEFLSRSIAEYQWQVRSLGYFLVKKSKESANVSCLGVAMRRLLSRGLSDSGHPMLAAAAIEFVVGTLETNPRDSIALLEEIFKPDRLSKNAWNDVPSLTRCIKDIARTQPSYAASIYGHVYAYDVTEQTETYLGNSQILPLRSNARQDYDMARYSLVTFFPEFLDTFVNEATDSLIVAVREEALRRFRLRKTWPFKHSTTSSPALFQEDGSHIWAHDTEHTYGHDADALLLGFLTYIRACSEEQLTRAVGRIVKQVVPAVIWARLFQCAAKRADSISLKLSEYALSLSFLVCFETRKDAIDLIAEKYLSIDHVQRESFERQILSLDLKDFDRDNSGRDRIIHQVLVAIGRNALLSDEARVELDRIEKILGIEASNPRPLVVTSGWSSIPRWANQDDPISPADQNLRSAIDLFESAFIKDSNPPAKSASLAFSCLQELHKSVMSADNASSDLVEEALGILAVGIKRRLVSWAADPLDVKEVDWVTSVLNELFRAKTPEVQETIEAQFADSPHWGSPAVRLEAAEALLVLCRRVPAKIKIMSGDIERLMQDRHPAVRFQMANHLLKLWDAERDYCCKLVRHVCETEKNLGVLDFFVPGVLGTLIHRDTALAEELLAGLVERFSREAVDIPTNLRQRISQQFTILWVRYERKVAYQQLKQWIADIGNHAQQMRSSIFCLRQAIGDIASEDVYEEEPLKKRARHLIFEICESAGQVLDGYKSDDNSEASQQAVQAAMQILDTACMEVFFGSDSKSVEVDLESASVYLRRLLPLLNLLSRYGTPHTVYYLLQLLERFVDANPSVVFNVAADALLEAGVRYGYQHESLGADLWVKLVGQFLADHKEIFEGESNRKRLVECLELFEKAGWPAARRLLYRLPEYVQ